MQYALVLFINGSLLDFNTELMKAKNDSNYLKQISIVPPLIKTSCFAPTVIELLNNENQPCCM